jgi:acetoacetyl-CoA synthetase
VLLDGSSVVGFDEEAALVCNISSWAVHPKYRGWGMALLAAVLQDESLTYTAFTPGSTGSIEDPLLTRFKPPDIEKW